MAEHPRLHHISSAVVSALPERVAAVLDLIAAFPDTEVHHVQNGKIVIVLEGASTGEIGSRLTEIGRLDGVLSACLVFEQITEFEDCGVTP